MSALENGFSMSTSWYALFSVFLMNVQLGQNYHQRDMVDHAAAVAADTVTKTLCADTKDYGGVPQGQYSGAREKAVKDATSPILDLVAPKNACKVSAKSGGAAGGSADGKKQMDVSVNCEIPCNVPFAAQIMCKGGPGKSHVNFEAKQKATATGCDSGSGTSSAGLGSGG
jgi:hypothetical protein